jgi:hypothetical protein
VAQVAAQQGHWLDAGKIHRLGRGGHGAQHPRFQAAFVDLTAARPLRRRLPRGKNPPEGREPIVECSVGLWAGCL